MINEFKWESISDSEETLKDENGKTIACLRRLCDCEWNCELYNDDCNIKCSVMMTDIENIEEARWQATLLIYNMCKEIVKSFVHIRNNLPILQELRLMYEEKNRKEHI